MLGLGDIVRLELKFIAILVLRLLYMANKKIGPQSERVGTRARVPFGTSFASHVHECVRECIRIYVD